MNQPPVPLDIVNPTVVVTTLPAALDPLPVGNALLPGQVGVVGADVPVEILLLGTALPDVLRTDGALVGTRVVVFVFVEITLPAIGSVAFVALEREVLLGGGVWATRGFRGGSCPGCRGGDRVANLCSGHAVGAIGAAFCRSSRECLGGISS